MHAPEVPRHDDGSRAALVACVVLSFGRVEDTLECLASLERSAYPNLRTVLLECDLAETDRSALQARFPGVDVVHLDENLGYAGNNNVGIRRALEMGADWVLLLNNDTTVDPECLGVLVREAEHHAGAGIVGPMVYHYDEPGVIQSAGGTTSTVWTGVHIGQNEADRQQYLESRLVDWVSGCALLASRSAIERIGGLDERYFMYVEEFEWCLRARRAGIAVLHVPKARIWHKGVTRDYAPSPTVTYYTTRNRLLTAKLHAAPASVRLLQVLLILRTLSSWTVRPKWRRAKAAHRAAMWRGAVDYLRGRWGRMPA